MRRLASLAPALLAALVPLVALPVSAQVRAAAPAASAPVSSITVQGRRDDEAAERRQSVLGLTVIGRDELDARGDVSVLDVLARVPGVDIDGDQPRLRGLGGGYTQILINGEPAPPGFSMDQLAPADIERIEVIKGATAEFGGVAGTINIILRRAPRVDQTELRQSIGYRAVAPQGSTSVSRGGRAGALGFHLPLTLFTWANGQELDTERESRDAGGARTLRRTVQQDRWLGSGLQFSPRLDWAFGERHTLQWQALVQANRSRNAGERDTEALVGAPPTTRRSAYRSRGEWALQRHQAQWAFKADAGARVELKAAWQRTSSRGESRATGVDLIGAPTTLRESGHRQDGLQLSQGGRWRLPAGESRTWSGGWDLERREHDEQRDLVEDGVVQRTGSLGVPFAAVTDRTAAFVQHEWSLSDRWSLSAAVRAEQWRFETAGPPGVERHRYGALLPLLHVRHALDKAGRDVLRASVATSQRAPDIGLLLPRYTLDGTYPREETNLPVAPDTAGNPALAPERSRGLELAWERSTPEGGVISAGFFQREVRQLIRRRIALETVTEAPVPRWVSRPVNLGRAFSRGLELEWRHRVPDGAAAAGTPGRAGLTWRSALSLYRSRVEQIDDPDARLEGQPPWRLTLGADRQWAAGHAAGATLMHTPGFSTQQSDRQRIWRGAQTRVDAFLSWRQAGVGQWRLAVINAFAPPQDSRSAVTDIGGFDASARSRREGVAQWTASFQTRF